MCSSEHLKPQEAQASFVWVPGILTSVQVYEQGWK